MRINLQEGGRSGAEGEGGGRGGQERGEGSSWGDSDSDEGSEDVNERRARHVSYECAHSGGRWGAGVSA